MSGEDLGDALKGVLEGAIIVLFGTIVGRGAGLLTEVWVVRLFSQSEYGLFRLSILVTTLIASIATLGFVTAIPRQLGVERGEGTTNQVRQTIGAAFIVSSTASLFLAVLLYRFASQVAVMFDTPALAGLLRTLAVALPVVVLLDLIVAVSRGLGNSRPKLYFRTLVPKFGFLAGVAVVNVLEYPFETIVIAWVGSHVLAVAASVVYARTTFEHQPSWPSVTISRDLVRFSFPLLAVYIINSIGSWIDTFVVGYHGSATVVGLYSATVLLTRLIPMVLGSVSFMYVPIASKFHGRNDQETVSMIYTTMTKWITGLTLPIFLTFILFPGDILSAVFGPEFRNGATVMQLLAIGFMTHTLLGTNGQSLIMLGRRRFLALSQSASVSMNLALSFALVPLIGIEGAAIGSAVAYTITNVITSMYLYHVAGLHPFSWNYVIPVGITIAIFSGIGVLVSPTTPLSLGTLFLFAMAIGLAHASVYIVTRSVNEGELEMVRAVSSSLGLPVGPVVRILKWASKP
ncbi:flippase [Natrinema amylolyticum]|uniref:flippase n=1 Tax=Natrinema amylolyticum TaxID=2878679 RepID=UPI001CFAB5FE|nr:flippase [Natrinema amylolyticum]